VLPPRRTGSGRPHGPWRWHRVACRHEVCARRLCPVRGAARHPAGQRARRTSGIARTSTQPAWEQYPRPQSLDPPVSLSAVSAP